jgi:hypothetical protein
MVPIPHSWSLKDELRTARDPNCVSIADVKKVGQSVFSDKKELLTEQEQIFTVHLTKRKKISKNAYLRSPVCWFLVKKE